VKYTDGRPEEELKCHEVKKDEVRGGGRYGSEGARRGKEGGGTCSCMPEGGEDKIWREGGTVPSV
jgi:hypothetical protein